MSIKSEKLQIFVFLFTPSYQTATITSLNYNNKQNNLNESKMT